MALRFAYRAPASRAARSAAGAGPRGRSGRQRRRSCTFCTRLHAVDQRRAALGQIGACARRSSAAGPRRVRPRRAARRRAPRNWCAGCRARRDLRRPEARIDLEQNQDRELRRTDVDLRQRADEILERRELRAAQRIADIAGQRTEIDRGFRRCTVGPAPRGAGSLPMSYPVLRASTSRTCIARVRGLAAPPPRFIERPMSTPASILLRDYPLPGASQR